MKYFSVLTCLYFPFLMLLGCQSYEKTISYTARDRNFVSFHDVSEFDMMFNFESHRIGKGNEFKDTRILCGSDSMACSLQFRRKRNGDWFSYSGEIWQPFFTNEDSSLHISTYSYSIYDSIIPVGAKLIRGVKIWSFRLTEGEWKSEENNSVFWFDPDYGIIAITNPERCLVREDWKPWAEN